MSYIPKMEDFYCECSDHGVRVIDKNTGEIVWMLSENGQEFCSFPDDIRLEFNLIAVKKLQDMVTKGEERNGRTRLPKDWEGS